MKQTDGAEKQLELLLQRRTAGSSLRATAVRQRMRSISWES